MGAIRILGIDPGSRLTGYGCVDLVGKQVRHVAHGTLMIAKTHGKATVPLEDRLLLIHQKLSAVIRELKPEVMAIEKVFFAKNAVSALKLGQARGAAILTGAMHGLKIVEYNPTEVKAALVGHGRAEKEQVAHMVCLILGNQEFATTDASDALALALCHAQLLGSRTRSVSVPSSRRKKMSLAECVGITSDEVKRTERDA